MFQKIEKIINALVFYAAIVAAANIVCITVIVFIQVLLNTIDRLASIITGQALGLTIPSYSEFTGFFLAATSFLALAYTYRKGAHINVSLFIEKATKPLVRVATIFCYLLTMFCVGYFSYYCFLLVWESFIYEDLSYGIIAIPLWIPQLNLAIGLLIFFLALGVDFINILLKKQKGLIMHTTGKKINETTSNETI